MVAIRARVQTGGINRALNTLLRDSERDADQIVRGWALRLINLIVENSPVDTGFFRANWQLERIGWAHYRISNPTVYGGVIEFGGYRGVGPKTQQVSAHLLPNGIAINAGIYSTSGAVAPVRRAVSQLESEIRRGTRRQS